MNDQCVLREPAPWSLRRLTVYRSCKRRFFLQYLLPISEPFTPAGRQLQADLRDFLMEHPPPLHWASNLLAATNRALSEHAHCTAEAIERRCRRELLLRSRLTDSERHARLRQMHDAGWFGLIAERLKLRPFTYLPVSGIERFALDDLHVLLLSGVTFIENDGIAIVMRPALPPRETDLIADALQTFFVMRKSPSTKEIRIRKLILPDDSDAPAEWHEHILTARETRLATELIHAYADEMKLRERSKPFTMNDFPADPDGDERCAGCPFQRDFCDAR